MKVSLLATCGIANILVSVGEDMHLQFLIEDQSGGALIDTILSAYLSDKPRITYSCRPFKGIGGFNKSNNVKRAKTQKLLNDLTLYLKGFDKSLAGIDSAIFIILDNDERDVESFSHELNSVAKSTGITIDHVFCIAVEEMEAWLLGDLEAIQKAYPNARLNIINSYAQDSICGTWEVLANAIYSGGLKKFLKDCPTFREIGLFKTIWAESIGVHMRLDKNKSPSFQFFLSELNKRIA